MSSVVCFLFQAYTYQVRCLYLIFQVLFLLKKRMFFLFLSLFPWTFSLPPLFSLCLFVGIEKATPVSPTHINAKSTEHNILTQVSYGAFSKYS